MIIAVSITVCCVVVVLVCAVVCVIKCHKSDIEIPSSTKVLTQPQHEPIKQPEEDIDQYKSLLHYKHPVSNHNWNTTSRYNHGPDMDTVERQTHDKQCSSLPWPKKSTDNCNISEANVHATMNNTECPKYFILDKDLVNTQRV